MTEADMKSKDARLETTEVATPSGGPQIRVLVARHVGTVGKSTMVANLLEPRTGGAVGSVETTNIGAGAYGVALV
jgi:hypothetical protein